MGGSHPRVLTVSPKELLVLELLRHQELYGLQLVAASRGRLKRGTVYVTLGRMEEKGCITSTHCALSDDVTVISAQIPPLRGGA